MAASSPAQVPTRRIARLWFETLPLLAGRAHPQMGALLAEGRYLLAWPGLASIAPAVALVVGLLVGADSEGKLLVFAFSPTALFTGLAMGAVAPLLGVLFVLGFALTHAFYTCPRFPDNGCTMKGEVWTGTFPEPTTGAALAITYLVFAALVVSLPLTATAVASRIGPTRAGPRWVGLRAIVGAAVAAVLAYAFAEALPLLIRPLWVWNNLTLPDEPTLAALKWAPALAGFAALAVAARVGVQHLAEREAGPLAASARHHTLAAGGRKSMQPLRVGLPILLAAALATAIFAGALSSWPEAGRFFLGVVAIGALRVGLALWGAAWTKQVDAIAPPLRFGLALLIGYLASYRFIGPALTSYERVAQAALLVGFIFAIAFPPHRVAGSKPAPGAQAVVGS